MEEDDEVSFGEVFGAWDAMWFKGSLFTLLRVDGHGGVDLTLIVHGEEHGTIKAVVFAEDFRQHGHGLFAAVFLVGCDDDDVFAFAWAVSA